MGKQGGNSQIVSRQRVAEHGEVYTGEREVNAMLDLVRAETERIESRFLEPACGNGNFMVAILRRKLRMATTRYGRDKGEWAERAVQAVSSVYGIDILADNVEASRQRLFALFAEAARQAHVSDERVFQSVKYVLSRNILHGDALTLMTVGDSPKPIVFSEWTFIGGGNVKRRDYELAELMRSTPMEGPNLFSDLGDEAFIPTPVKEYKSVSFLNLSDYDTDH